MLVNGPLKEFNRPEFFMAVQLAVLFYYPTVALGIMYQGSDQDTDQFMQQIQEQQEQSDQFIQTQFSQFVQFVQRMIIRTKQQVMVTQSNEMMTKTKNKADTNSKMMSGEVDGVRVEVMIKVQDQGTKGEGRQVITRGTVWNTVYITL